MSSAACYACRQSQNSPVYYVAGDPVYREVCLIGRQGYPTIGLLCPAFNPAPVTDELEGPEDD
jgi:hypothetical protein